MPRFIPDAELPAYFERADLVVLPYLEADQSGVLFTALAFGKPLLLSDVGGFPEVAATGAARTVPAGDSAALGAALRELLAEPAALAAMAERARAAAAGPYSWDAITRPHDPALPLTLRVATTIQPSVPSPSLRRVARMVDRCVSPTLLSGPFRDRTSRRRRGYMGNPLIVLAIALLVALLVIDRLAR